MFWNRKKPLYILLIFCLWLSACVHPAKQMKASLTEEQMDHMDQAFLLMKNKDFLKAAQMYDELAGQLLDSSSKILMLFNAGTAYKEAGDCDKALFRFRRLLDHSLTAEPFKARGLIEISYVYECLGNTDSAMLSLKSAQKFRSSLPWMLNQVVYPARLAIAYAWEENPKAEHYKSLALTRILQAKKVFSSEAELNERISRMFYLMGRSYMKKEKIQTEVFLKAFPYHQLFLLQSLFLRDRTWSRLSQQDLSLLFDKLSYTLSKMKNKQKYKKLIIQAIESGRVLVRKEKSKHWNSFYYKKSKPVLNLLNGSIKKSPDKK